MGQIVFLRFSMVRSLNLMSILAFDHFGKGIINRIVWWHISFYQIGNSKTNNLTYSSKLLTLFPHVP